jgi:2-polyprenyl-3-methyl-5-hydroxy-6-metoxy-1,4-benzoquinol methylase
MTESINAVKDYGWGSRKKGRHTEKYLTPRILELLGILKVNRLLDMGCGDGDLCHALFCAGFDIVGADSDANGVEIARHTYQSIPFYNQGVQDDPLGLLAKENGRKFDAVVSSEVVEHLFSPHLLPIYARGVLKEGGYLLITTPYHGYLKNLVLSITNHWDAHHSPLWHGGHIKFWSRATLTRLLSENGFEVIGFHGAGRLPYLWMSMILVARKKIDSAVPGED